MRLHTGAMAANLGTRHQTLFQIQMEYPSVSVSGVLISLLTARGGRLQPQPQQRSPLSLPGSCRSHVLSVFPSTAIDLLYWRDIKQTGIVFGSFLLLLFSLTQFSVVSVVAYLALAALSATISFRIYKSVLQAVQKTDEGHPFK